MFRLMLNSHPDIVVPPECGFALWWFDKHKDWTYDPQKRDAFLDDFFTSKKIENWHLDRHLLSDRIDQMRPASYAELVDMIYFLYAETHGMNPVIWGDKNNFYINFLDELRRLFPKANILFLTRDGRDVACSYKELNNSDIESKYLPDLPGEINEIAKEWVGKNRKIIDLCESLDPGQWLHVRFEDLITGPAEELNRIVDFLGLEYNDAMLDYHTDDSEPADTLQWKPKTKEPPDPMNIEKYRNILSQVEIDAFNHIASDMLKRFNYSG